MAIDSGAQVVHDALADRVGDQRLCNSKRTRGHRDHDHSRDQPRQENRVALRDRLVEHRPQKERRDHPQRSGDQDQEEDRS